MDLKEPIWREDVIDERDYVQSFTRVLIMWSERLRYQGAPPALIQRVDALRDAGAKMSDDLKDIEVCFPPEQ